MRDVLWRFYFFMALCVILVLVAIMIDAFFFEPPYRALTPLSLEVLFWIAGITLFAVFMYNLTLITAIDENGIDVKFAPINFPRRTISLEQIKTVDAVAYSAMAEFGGWGWRITASKVSYTLSGTQAIKITTTHDTKEIYIGTQSPKDMLAFLQKVINTAEA